MMKQATNGSATPLRMTRQREVILEAVRTFHGHPSADDVYAVVRTTLPSVSLATVYRNLELLAARGLIGSVHVAGSQKRFDVRADEHCHVRCDRCGALGDVRMSAVTGLEPHAEAVGFEITGHRVEFTGICDRCRTAGRGKKSMHEPARNGSLPQKTDEGV